MTVMTGGRDRIDRIVDRAEDAADARDLEQDDRGRERYQEADRRLLPRHGAAVFADDPGDGDEHEDAERRLEILHQPPLWSGPGAPPRRALPPCLNYRFFFFAKIVFQLFL